MRATIRFWTAIAIIGACAFSIARGWGIVHFSLAMAGADSAEKRAEIASAWTVTPDVASAALQVELREQADIFGPNAINRRHEALTSILSIKPLSSADWLSLAGAQLEMDRPMEDVLGSLKLSMLTGPNEGYVMTKRGIFGVWLWESLSPDLKRRVTIDLAAGDVHGMEKLRDVLSTKPSLVRNELREALRETGLSSKEVEYRLGP